MGGLVGGIVVGVLTGGFGFTLAAAGFWGGLAGGAVTGGLEGGWRGALIGGVVGGVLGAFGGWGVDKFGAGFGYGVLAAGTAYAAATDSWDSFAGGLIGGTLGYAAGYSIGSSGQGQRSGNGLSGLDDDPEIEIGSRPLGDPPSKQNPRHMFTRWKENGEYKYWEMGPNERGKIAINPTDSHQRTLRYIDKLPNQVKWTKTNVLTTSWTQSRASYEANWVGKTYSAGWRNSNYAVRTVIRNAGGRITGDLGWCPGGIHDLYGQD